MTTSKSLDWVGVLNALAGTSNLGAEAAANAYAGLTMGPSTPTSPPTILSVVGALNVKAGNGRSPAGWRGLSAVCNQIAGTTNLEPLAALRIHAGLQ